jgi:hypothetical protein
MRKSIYLAVIERLKQIKDADGISKIKHFDLWNHNVEFIEQETAFETPAVFIEFGTIEWATLAGGLQQANVIVSLHIVTRYKGAASDGSVDQAEAISHFDLLDEIGRYIFGLKGEGFQGFKRIRSQTNHNHEELIENIETYTTFVITGK